MKSSIFSFDDRFRFQIQIVLLVLTTYGGFGGLTLYHNGPKGREPLFQGI